MPDEAAPPPAIQHLRISTHDLPHGDYVAAVRELLGRDLLGSDLRHADGGVRPLAGFRYHATLSLLGPGAAYIHGAHTPMQARRTAALMADGMDDIFIALTHGTAGSATLCHPKGEIAVPQGSIVLMSKAREHCGINPWHAVTTGLQVPRAALARRLPRLEEAPMHVFHPGAPGTDSAALALDYAALLARQGSLSCTALTAAAEHLHQLLASAIDAPRAASRPPPGQAQQARLALMRRDIHKYLNQRGFDLRQLARLHNTTPRQVQRMLATQDTSFTGVLGEARMQHAHALLTSPAHQHLRVLEIALDSGFDGISAFSRAFRRHFGITPTEAREAAQAR
ncbi:MAG: helix-turn-helix transcriptional regulator [Ottowia sp.]|uniref:helix-turn-helix transcriptional regulator n=1 Tax=Ottowia sp. TaxID=1898956 RepID=UPI0039E462B5